MSFDTFDFRARTLPVVIAFVPVYVCAMLIAIEVPAAETWWNLLPIPVALALSALVTHLGRDAGKGVEKALWENWGGPPTTQMLRWAGAENPITQQDLHESLQAIVGTNITLPTSDQEKEDPTRADHIYEAAVRTLIARTGDKEKYPKLKNDLIGYCFRRNVYGLRTFAIAVAGFLVIGSIVAIVALPSTPVDVGPTIPIVTLLIALVWIVLYAAWFTSNWVRRAADAYADELSKRALEART
ncbi:hypothetical protein CEY15_04820 [Dietzia natronolimnaea]|uniref:Uncharacterized protein n=1 Tax=Dietzia natronolimnaea TaxID=161920 RepID=A0A2A2WSF5_9ACTN|nr:hypothetical protein [Dietzia natronolimnaea]PAY24130.1 hypothetical protein CEY15_04820 [Dietzia natronolimnaea]